MHASIEKQSNLEGGSLGKRHWESYPALISEICLFLLCLSKMKYHSPLPSLHVVPSRCILYQPTGVACINWIFSPGTISCFVYPVANQTLLLYWSSGRTVGRNLGATDYFITKKGNRAHSPPINIKRLEGLYRYTSDIWPLLQRHQM